MLYFRLFCKEISKPCRKFSRVWTKNTIVWEILRNFWKFFAENSMKKLNLYLFLGKFVAKNRNLGNSIIFLQHFFRFGGGEGLNPPCVRHSLRDVQLATENETIHAKILVCSVIRLNMVM